MPKKTVRNEIEEKVAQLRKHNETLMNQGDTVRYQHNCNILHGISIAVQIMQRHGVYR